MKLSKALIQDLLMRPKAVLTSRVFSRGALACLLVSLFVGGVVYLKQHTVQKQTVQKQTVQQKIAELKNLDADYMQVITELQMHIESLNSRVKHLSMDNKRLSSTGTKLSKQLNIKQSSIAQKLSQAKVLQLELATLDHNIIRGYEDFIEQQEVVINLHLECKKSKDKNSKDKNKKCDSYVQMRTNADTMALQLKHLKAKREVLLSQIARAGSGL